MKVKISKKLEEIYKKQHKNFDYAITSALDNFDPDSFVTCFEIVEDFKVSGDKCEITIGDNVAERIISDLERTSLDGKDVEILLWIGAVLPEV